MCGCLGLKMPSLCTILCSDPFHFFFFSLSFNVQFGFQDERRARAKKGNEAAREEQKGTFLIIMIYYFIIMNSFCPSTVPTHNRKKESKHASAKLTFQSSLLLCFLFFVFLNVFVLFHTFFYPFIL